MEVMIAVAKIRVCIPNKPPLTKYFDVWIKKAKLAKEACEAKLEEHETLVAVWTCKWRGDPSDYTLVYGSQTHENQQPNLDMAKILRERHLKKRNQGKGKRHGIAQLVDKAVSNAISLVKPEIPAYHPYTTKEAA